MSNQMSRRALVLALVAAGLVSTHAASSLRAQEGAGTWPAFKGDLQRTGFSAESVTPPLNLLWRHTVDLPNTTLPSPNSASPLVLGPRGARRVYFATNNQVIGIDAETGAKVWDKARSLEGTVRAPLVVLPAESGDLILAATTNGYVSAIKATDGNEEWRIKTEISVPVAPLIVNTPAGQRILVPLETGVVQAYTTKGQLDPKWKVTLGRFGASPVSSPVLSRDGKRFFIVGNDQTIYSVDIAQGKVVSATPLAGLTDETPAILGTRMVAAGGENLVAMSTSNGAVVWSLKLDGRIMGSPAGQGLAGGKGTVYAGTDAGTLYAVDLSTGKTKWKTSLGNSVTGTPLVTPGAVFVGTGNGLFVAAKPADGTIAWRYRLHTERLIQNQDRGFGGGGGGGGRGRFGGNDGNVMQAPGPEGFPQGAPTGDPGAPQTMQFPGAPGDFPGAPNGRGFPGAPGFPGGGAPSGGGGIGQRLRSTGEIRTYGVSSAPAVVDGEVFLIADNGALFAFDSSPFDTSPPRIVEPTITIRSAQKTDYPYLLDSRMRAIPGRAPVYFAAQIEDRGSGIDASSVKISMNGKELAAADVAFNPANGVVTATLADFKGGTANNLDDGTVRLAVTAKDYSDNAMNYTASFNVNNDLEAPNDPTVNIGGFGGPGQGGGRGRNRGNQGGGPGGFQPASDGVALPNGIEALVAIDAHNGLLVRENNG